MSFSIVNAAKQAKQAAVSLATLDTQAKNQLLQDIADQLIAQTEDILVENQKDLASAKKMVCLKL